MAPSRSATDDVTPLMHSYIQTDKHTDRSTQRQAVTDLRGREGCTPPWGSNSFNFMQFFGKIGKIICWHLPGDLAPPPRGNPGSATADNFSLIDHMTTYLKWLALNPVTKTNPRDTSVLSFKLTYSRGGQSNLSL